MKKPVLTPYQGGRVQLAEDALEASMKDSNPENYPMHLGKLEIFLDDVLQVISEVCGEDRATAVSRHYRKGQE
jgi:hypothetical protein